MFPVGCLFCEQDNPVGSRFCNECGKALRHKPCRACGAVADRDAARCVQCGHAFVQTSAQEAETVAWADIESDLAEIESGLAARRSGPGLVEGPPPAVHAPSRLVGPALSSMLSGSEPVVRDEPRPAAPRLSAKSRMPVEPRVPAAQSVTGLAPSSGASPTIGSASTESVLLESAPVGPSRSARPGLPPESPAPKDDRRRGLLAGGLVAALVVVGLSGYVFLRETPGAKGAPAAAAPAPAGAPDSVGSALPAAPGALVDSPVATGSAKPVGPAAPAGSTGSTASVAPAVPVVPASVTSGDRGPAAAVPASASRPAIRAVQANAQADPVGSPSARPAGRSLPAAGGRAASRQDVPEARACTEAVATLGLCQPSAILESSR